MKKQINPTIKAHLIRGAFYLLLLLAVCAIPFALAQRNAFKLAQRNVDKQSAGQPRALAPSVALRPWCRSLSPSRLGSLPAMFVRAMKSNVPQKAEAVQ